MVRRISEQMTVRARALRNGATDAERALWHRLAPYRPRFTRQLVIGSYIVDIANRTAKLIIELDGSQHVGSAHDEARTAWLSAQGWRVIRFWNNEVLANPDGVAEAVLLQAAECLGGTHPQPLPFREGRRLAERSDGS